MRRFELILSEWLQRYTLSGVSRVFDLILSISAELCRAAKKGAILAGNCGRRGLVIAALLIIVKQHAHFFPTTMTKSSKKFCTRQRDRCSVNGI